MDPISEGRLEKVHPKLAQRIRQLADFLEGEKISIRVVQGLRTWAEQDQLWRQGRDAVGNVVDAKKVVTHAPPGHSYHNFGLAVDVAPFDGNIPDWNVNHPAWKRIVEAGESMGLAAGAKWRTFPDFPHFQYVGLLPVSPDSAIRALYAHGGIEAVWDNTGMDG